MLTAEIKSKIDSARNILVGKIPTPTGQVEQITLALVYKFMNDIDEQNKELGGELKFFTGEYSKYAWKHLLDKSLSAYERVTAYGEGLEKMYLNPNLPQFFRNVFRGAFLPFRDPEVLTIFLKQIDEFKYGVNGDLGDAFEYLLQEMGTQGDAGQFLTPRHIINFIVSIVDPLKTDKILDPAEGTAGFLISSYLHILKQNTKTGSETPGSSLTYDERKKLSDNLVGYDISHDMVRLSLVNLYLHGFADPKIYEYDTLGNLDRWDDDFDCILTNPPFMTPKGGVKPHKRFSIQAKKSEVLFVDYIMEHLNPNGKAGIIVPEGIIFQSATAYKALRKMMVDQNFLYAVVSLPAGVFNPYSNVKTSVLLMDRVLAKKTKNILFVKVEDDGFDLGAQRRPIEKNDLPQAAEMLKRYKTSLQIGKSFSFSDEDKKIVNLVPIEKISKSGDYNLSGDRYKETKVLFNEKWSLVELGGVVDILDSLRKPVTKGDRKSGPYPYYGATGILDYVDDFIFDERLVLVGEDGAKWGCGEKTSFIAEGKYWVNNHAHIMRPHKNLIVDTFLVNVLNEMDLSFYITGVTVPKLNQENLKSIKIPLPPLEVQQEIVSHLDSYQKIIDGAKQVVDNYKPEIKIDSSWEMVELGKVATMMSGGTPSKLEKEYWDGDIPWVSPKDMKVNFIEDTEDHISLKAIKNSATKLVNMNTILCVVRSGILQHTLPVTITMKDMCFNQDIIAINVLETRLDVRYLFYFMKFKSKEILQAGIKPGVTVQSFTNGFFKTYNIPLPPLDIQKEIVSRIEEEQQLVNANKKLIELYQGKIKEKIDEVWGE